MHIKMQYAICRHAISLNIILVKPTKCTLSKMHKMHIGILARMPFLAPTSYPLFHHQIRPGKVPQPRSHAPSRLAEDHQLDKSNMIQVKSISD